MSMQPASNFIFCIVQCRNQLWCFIHRYFTLLIWIYEKKKKNKTKLCTINWMALEHFSHLQFQIASTDRDVYRRYESKNDTEKCSEWRRLMRWINWSKTELKLECTFRSCSKMVGKITLISIDNDFSFWSPAYQHHSDTIFPRFF